jgi:hypothetical protein
VFGEGLAGCSEERRVVCADEWVRATLGEGGEAVVDASDGAGTSAERTWEGTFSKLELLPRTNEGAYIPWLRLVQSSSNWKYLRIPWPNSGTSSSEKSESARAMALSMSGAFLAAIAVPRTQW